MKWMKKWFYLLSIKQKWTVATALTILVSYALISCILFIAVHNWLINDEERTARSTAVDVQTFFTAEGGSISVQDIQNNTSLMSSVVDKDQTIRIYNFDDIEVIRINDSYGSNKTKPNVEEIQHTKIIRTTIDNTDVYVVYAPIQIGVFKGYMELVHPLVKFHSMMRYLLTMLLILGVGAIVIATTLSRYISSLLLKPIQQLRDSMNDVKERGLYVEPSFTYSAQDEIGDLLSIYHLMLDELKESFMRQQQFVQDASHELRTPIQAIEGHLSLIERWGKNDPEVLEESLQTSLIEVRRMKKLMEELLLLARNEEKQYGATADVEQVLRAVSQEQLFINPEVSIDFITKGESKKGVVTEGALNQITRNIIENAIHYRDKDCDKDSKIVISIEYLTQHILVSIADNGIGIDKEHLPYIFNRFYRIDNARVNVKGSTGLGLSITKMLADKYQIAIEVTSQKHVGTTFTLIIPTFDEEKRA